MTEDLVLYTHPMSRGRIVRWMLEEIGAPYETKLIDYGPAMKGPSYLAINPMGKVPALVHADVVVTETAAIVAYLADVFPEAHLAPPASSQLRGPYYRWMFFAAGPLEAASTNHALGVTPAPDRRGMVGYGTLEEVMNTLDGVLTESQYLLGDQFTGADVYVGSMIGWGMQFGTLEKRPAFERYWADIGDRPAAVKARAIDDALMPPK